MGKSRKIKRARRLNGAPIIKRQSAAAAVAKDIEDNQGNYDRPNAIVIKNVAETIHYNKLPSGGGTNIIPPGIRAPFNKSAVFVFSRF